MCSQQLRRITETMHLLEGYYAGPAKQWHVDANFSLMQKDGYNRNASSESVSDLAYERCVLSVDDSQGRMAAFEANASRPLARAANLRFGVVGTFSTRRDNVDNPDGTLGSTRQKVNEGNGAVYAEWSQGIGKCNLRLGLRYEHTDSRYFDNGVKQQGQSRIYNELLPSVSFVAPIGKSQLQLSYARKSMRPLYSQLSDQVYYVNRYVYESGNSHLRSVLRDDVSLNYRVGWFMLMAQYTRQDGRIITRISPYQGDAHITLLQKTNSEKDMHSYSVLASFSPRFKAYTPMLLAGVIGQHYDVSHLGCTLHMNNPMLMVRFNNIYAFSPTAYVRADFNFMSAGDSENLRMKNYWSINMSATKTFGKHWMLQLQVNDLFNASRKRSFVMYDALQSVHMEKCTNTRSILLSVRYRFNTTPSKYKGKGAGENERERF